MWPSDREQELVGRSEVWKARHGSCSLRQGEHALWANFPIGFTRFWKDEVCFVSIRLRGDFRHRLVRAGYAL